jgi:DNA modification methylase
MTTRILTGDCLATLRTLPDGAAQTCVTSPPYYGLRDYGHAGQIGLEDTPDAYVARLVEVFREVRRVLRDDGTLWLNIGDSYSTHAAGVVADPMKKSTLSGVRNATEANRTARERSNEQKRAGIPEKNLLMIPAILALALRADGWFLRSDIIWHKPNPMPESVRDRPTSAHEHVFLLSRRAAYFYDAEAIKEEAAPETAARYAYGFGGAKNEALKATDKPTAVVGKRDFDGGRNARNVWTIATQPYSGAHFATMPPALAERCIKAGSRPGDTVLDPFGGAGTTGLVADRLQRSAILCELNPEYARLACDRIAGDAPLLLRDAVPA